MKNLITALPPFLLLIFAIVSSPSAAALAAAPDCSRAAGSLPNAQVAAGTPDRSNPINHIVVIMQENHSFDNYFGSLNSPRFYGSEVDGIQPQMWNPDSSGRKISVYHETDLCMNDPQHGWNAMHTDWNGGRNDQFVRENDDPTVMGFYDQNDVPFYYALANDFAIGDRYFCSVLSQTFPNRFFLMAGTAFGHVKNDDPDSYDQFSQKTIFDVLDQYGISWKYYGDGPGYLVLFQPVYTRDSGKAAKLREFQTDLQNGTLPSVVFIESNFEGAEDEHPADNIQVGQQWVAERVNDLMASPYWKDSALFFTYDENGGFYDHVAPPEACMPDAVEPNLPSGSVSGHYDRYGFRVPFLAVSPWVKHHYVSHHVYDHTSILKFIETKYNLPALTARDANADGLADVFDFTHPEYAVPNLPVAAVDHTRSCN
jgi:phospholipase C